MTSKDILNHCIFRYKDCKQSNKNEKCEINVLISLNLLLKNENSEQLDLEKETF